MEHPDDAYLMARATRWVSDSPFPGLVEVQFSEQDGTVITIHEKAPVIDPERCRPDAAYPREVALLCRILDATTATYTVRLKHGVEDTRGRDVFVVRYEDVLPCRYDEIEFEQLEP